MNLSNLLKFAGCNVSMEAFKAIHKDEGVEQLIDHFDNLITVVKQKDLRDKAIFTKDSTKSIINEIDELIFERFGINAKHIYNASTVYAVNSIVPGKNNTLFKNLKETRETMKELSKYTDSNVEREIVDVDSDPFMLARQIHNSFLEMDKAFEKGFKVDLEKIRVTGLSRDVKFFLHANFSEMIHEHKLTARNITAIFLHELGHILKHLLYSFKTVKDSVSVMEDFISGVDKDNLEDRVIELSKEKTVFIGNKDKTGKVSGNIILDKIDEIHDVGNVDATSDSELLADVLPGKFGLGEDLAKGLDLVETHFLQLENQFVLTMSIMAMVYVMLISLSIALSLSIFFVTYIYYFVVKVVFANVMELIYGTDKSGNKVYDESKLRFTRIGLSLIKQLKNSDISKDERKALVSQYETIMELADERSSSATLLGLLGDIVIPSRREKRSKTIFIETTEKLINNKIYVASEKLKQL